MAATLQLLHPRPPPMTLVLYAPASHLAALLEARLPVGMRVHWQDSAAPPGALDVHRRSGPCVVLLDYLRGAAQASSELARRLQRSHPDLPLVAVGSTSSKEEDGIVAAVRAGLRDILDLEASTAEIDAVLRRAAALPADVPDLPAPGAAKARLILLLGVRAGVGTSTLATHLGVMAQQLAPPRAGEDHATDTLLVDLGQPAGDAALYLNVDSQFHYDDALRHANRIDANLVRTVVTRHEGGLHLLGQPASGDGGTLADPAVLMQRLRGVFRTVLRPGRCSGPPDSPLPPQRCRRNLARRRPGDRHAGLTRPGVETPGRHRQPRRAPAVGHQPPPPGRRTGPGPDR